MTRLLTELYPGRWKMENFINVLLVALHLNRVKSFVFQINCLQQCLNGVTFGLKGPYYTMIKNGEVTRLKNFFLLPSLCKVYANLRLIWFDSDTHEREKETRYTRVCEIAWNVHHYRGASSFDLQVQARWRFHFPKIFSLDFHTRNWEEGKCAIFMKKAKHLICKSLFFLCFFWFGFFSVPFIEPNQIYSTSNFISNIFRNWFNGFHRNAEEPTSKKKGILIAANSPYRHHHHHHRYIFIYEIA